MSFEEPSETLKNEIVSLRKELTNIREDLAVGTAYSSVVAIDSAGLHELSVSLSQGENIPHAVDRIKRMLKLVELTTWPDELKTKSHDLGIVLTDLALAFDEHNKEKVKELSPQMHAAYHRLCNSFYEWLHARNTNMA